MNYQVIEKNNRKYIACSSAATPLQDPCQALDLIAHCGENDTDLLMISEEVLTKDFFDLKTGVAGEILQKFINYRVRTALIVTDGTQIKGRFKEMMNESNQGNNFRVFNNRDQAENWLLK